MDVWNPRTRSVGLIVVAVAVGYLFGTSARIFGPQDSTRPDDIQSLVAERSAQLDEFEAEVSDLRLLRDAALERENPEVPVVSPSLVAASDGVAVRGDGVQVRLWDAPASSDSEVDPNDLVVHQQDLEAVVNAMWAGGAEAITIQGQRITSTTTIRCVGNVLLLHGRQYSPPYEISAIGDQDAIVASLNGTPTIQAYLEWVDRVGLGWELSLRSSIEMPAYDGSRQITYAVVLEESE